MPVANRDHPIETPVRSPPPKIGTTGSVNRLTGRHRQALSDLDRVLENNPGNSFALAERGALHLTNWRYEEAFNDLNSALEINPYNTWARDLRDKIPDTQQGRLWAIAYEVLKLIEERRRG
ncbi:hypothetical protein QCN29_05140 [Streptomyces sp. HNM0663]|uniref:Tetratricopeptide repeat protein n=1 Tax=Streptomyces chengmaiensis TaxID=3040919 RepID=A0ABT6HHE3_9ACTN|nr:hypothetical protein [Streptomyces chengmaiensis]MDH2388184.1 hypothetical protein [Streptomyces chengmaiensis]